MPFDSDNATRPSPRWTPSRIAKALVCPKPKGAIGKAMAYEGGRLLRPVLPTGDELEMLRHIAEHADLLDVPGPVDGSVSPYSSAIGWLLVPVPQWVIDGLAQLDAQMADLEPDRDREDEGHSEPDVDRESDADDEPDVDREPDHVRPETMSRRGLDDSVGQLVTAPGARIRARENSAGVRRWELTAAGYRRI